MIRLKATFEMGTTCTGHRVVGGMVEVDTQAQADMLMGPPFGFSLPDEPEPEPVKEPEPEQWEISVNEVIPSPEISVNEVSPSGSVKMKRGKHQRGK